MSDTVADERDTWVASVFQVDPRTYAGAAGAAGAAAPSAAAAGGFIDDLKYAATTVENFAGDVWSDVKIGAEAVEQKVEGGIDVVVEKAEKAGEAIAEGAEKVADKVRGKDTPPTGRAERADHAEERNRGQSAGEPGAHQAGRGREGDADGYSGTGEMGRVRRQAEREERLQGDDDGAAAAGRGGGDGRGRQHRSRR